MCVEHPFSQSGDICTLVSPDTLLAMSLYIDVIY